MIKRRKAELLAGLFLNLGLALTMLAIFLFGSRLSLFSRDLHYRFLVSNAQGLLVGTKVLIAGVEAGHVERIALDEQTRSVQVDISVRPKYRNAVREDSFVDLSTQGILGDRIVIVEPGDPVQPMIPSGGVLPTRISPNLHQLFDRLDGLFVDVDHLVLRIDRIIETFGPEKEEHGLASSAREILRNLSELTNKLSKGLDWRRANNALARLDSILEKIDDGRGTLGAFLNDPSLYDDTKALVGEANRNRVLRNLVRKSIQDAQEKKNPTG